MRLIFITLILLVACCNVYAQSSKTFDKAIDLLEGGKGYHMRLPVEISESYLNKKVKKNSQEVQKLLSMINQINVINKYEFNKTHEEKMRLLSMITSEYLNERWHAVKTQNDDSKERKFTHLFFRKQNDITAFASIGFHNNNFSLIEIQGDCLDIGKIKDISSLFNIDGIDNFKSIDSTGDVQVVVGVQGNSSIKIRGKNTISGNGPLFVLDGVIQEAGKDISQINPESIHSITVLKEPSAIALYGYAAQDGVIIITTKAHAAATGKDKENPLNSGTSIKKK